MAAIPTTSPGHRLDNLAGVGHRQLHDAVAAELNALFGTIRLAAAAVHSVTAVQASTANPTTTSTTAVTLPDMTVSFTPVAGGVGVLVLCRATLSHGTVGGQLFLSCAYGATVGRDYIWSAPIVGGFITHEAGLWVPAPAASAVTVKAQWYTNAGTATATGVSRELLIVEFKR